LRNAGKRDWRRQRAAASLGKHHPFPHSQPDSESFGVTFVNCVRNTVCVTNADVRISRFQPRSNGVVWFDACAGEFTRGIPKSSQQTEAVKVNTRDAREIDPGQYFAVPSQSVSFSLSSSSSKSLGGEYQRRGGERVRLGK
jgi:hypothetical protein